MKRFMRMFEAGVRFGQHLPSTVNQLSDFFALVSGHLLIEIYRETGQWEKRGRTKCRHAVVLLSRQLY